MFNCLGCNTHFSFASTTSRFYACPSCNTVHQREGDGVIKKMVTGIFEEDMSPIMLGSTGNIDGKKFFVVGRTRFIFKDWYLNQWNLFFSDGTVAYIGEYCGSYSLHTFNQDAVQMKHLANLKPGKIIPFKNSKKYLLVGIQESKDFECEGELFIIPEKSFIHLELASDNTAMALINIYSKTSMDVFSGRFLEFKELNLTRIRSAHGWE